MMFCRYDKILHARIRCGLGPEFGIIQIRIEVPEVLSIGFIGDLFP